MIQMMMILIVIIATVIIIIIIIIVSGFIFLEKVKVKPNMRSVTFLWWCRGKYKSSLVWSICWVSSSWHLQWLQCIYLLGQAVEVEWKLGTAATRIWRPDIPLIGVPLPQEDSHLPKSYHLVRYRTVSFSDMDELWNICTEITVPLPIDLFVHNVICVTYGSVAEGASLCGL